MGSEKGAQLKSGGGPFFLKPASLLQLLICNIHILEKYLHSKRYASKNTPHPTLVCTASAERKRTVAATSLPLFLSGCDRTRNVLNAASMRSLLAPGTIPSTSHGQFVISAQKTLSEVVRGCREGRAVSRGAVEWGRRDARTQRARADHAVSCASGRRRGTASDRAEGRMASGRVDGASVCFQL